MANILANRIGQVSFISLAGNPISYVLCFLICDIVNERYGEKEAKNLVNTGLIISLFYLFLLYSTYFIPAIDESFDEKFKTIFNNSYRIILASLCAYFVSNHLDVKIFSYFRKKGKNKVQRKMFSTIISQFIDSLVFCTIAFLGVIDLKSIFTLIIGEYIVKTTVNLAETPIYCLLTRGKTNV